MYNLCKFTVAAQEGPGIVIAHPGQDVELLCTVTVTSGNQVAAWLVNNMGPYRINPLRSGILAGYTTTLGNNNLIVENIMMNDDRNGSDYSCVIVPVQDMISLPDIIDESDPTILYVAGEYYSITHNYTQKYSLQSVVIIESDSNSKGRQECISMCMRVCVCVCVCTYGVCMHVVMCDTPKTLYQCICA